MARVKRTRQHVLDAIKDSHGVKAVIADRLGVTYQTVSNYIERWESVAEAYAEERLRFNDTARSIVIDAIKNGDVGTAKWWLGKQCADEFGDKMDITSGGERIEIVVKYADD